MGGRAYLKYDILNIPLDKRVLIKYGSYEYKINGSKKAWKLNSVLKVANEQLKTSM